MNLSERILRIATSHWTERSCFALTVAAALTGDGRMWIAAGTAVALTVGAIVAGSIAPLREARHAARDFPHTPNTKPTHAAVRRTRPTTGIGSN